MQKVIRWQQITIGFIVSFLLAPLIACSAPSTQRKMPVDKVSNEINITQKSNAPQKPVWPDNGIAQREFYGEQMFIENNKEKWRAWIISDPSRWGEWNKKGDKSDRGEVLDFFTGKTEVVYPSYSDDGHSEPEFEDVRRRKHRLSGKLDFHFDDPRPGGNVGAVSFDGDHLHFAIQERHCPPDLTVVEGYYPQLSGQPLQKWRKVPLFRSSPSKACPGGRWISLFGTSLDLGDGTFLATTQCYVFRLRMSDLSPVGAAPALHIVDAETIEKIIKSAEGKPNADLNADIAAALSLPPVEVSSCKDMP